MKAIPALALAGRAVLLFLLALAAGVPPARAADANPPDRLTYQGFLVDANGLALGNTAPKNYDVIFRIYDSSSGGNRKWTEQQTLTVDKGYFSVLLGEGAQVGSEARPGLSTLFAATDASDRYVEITVKGIGAGGTDSTIAPRLRLLTAPYAFLAKSASQLVNAAGSNYVSVSGTTVTVTGTISADSISANSFTGSGASLTGLSAGQIPSLDASKITTGTLGTNVMKNLRLSNSPLYFRHGTDTGHGVGYFGTDSGGSMFASVNVDGPVLFGYTGGALGTRGVGGEKIALQWDSSKNVTFGGTISGNGSGLTSLNAGNITSGTLSTSRIPDLDASKITSGTLSSGLIPSTFVRTDTLHSLDPSGNNKLRIGDAASGGPNRIVFGDSDYVFIGEEATDDEMAIKGSNGIYMKTKVGDAFSIKVWGGNQTGTRLHHYTGTAEKYVDTYRTDAGLIFEVIGGTTQGGATTRTISYDGDSNWDFTSDRRLKTNIVDAESVLQRVMAVKMRRFRWIGGSPEAAPELGVIAQEFQPLFPELVGKETPLTPNPACPDGVMTVGLTSLGTIAIKAIQELKQEKDGEIAGLRQENTLLKEKIEQLSRQAAHVAQLEQEMATLKKLVARAVELRRDERPVAGTPVTSSSGTGGN